VLGRATYLVLMGACLLVTLPLELVLKAGVYRRPRRWLAALVPVFLAFNLWDWVAIHRGHWTYSPRYTTGISFISLPLEELVFFLVVPTCALLTYQAVTHLLPPRPRPRGQAPR
jgi:lycopene beta-cyclase